jgi:hypothetical protein
MSDMGAELVNTLTDNTEEASDYHCQGSQPMEEQLTQCHPETIKKMKDAMKGSNLGDR